MINISHDLGSRTRGHVSADECDREIPRNTLVINGDPIDSSMPTSTGWNYWIAASLIEIDLASLSCDEQQAAKSIKAHTLASSESHGRRYLSCPVRLTREKCTKTRNPTRKCFHTISQLIDGGTINSVKNSL